MIREEGDRRWKRVPISPLDIFGLFLPWHGLTECFSQLALDPGEFPEKYVIDHVWYDVCVQAWWLLVYHPSFDDVPPGREAPVVHRRVETFFLPKCRSLEEARALGESLLTRREACRGT